MQGVCQKAFILTDESEYKTVTVWGNPVVNCSLQEKPHWHQTDEGREFYVYHKEDFTDDAWEIYCWITVGEYSEEELLDCNIDLESDETMIYLMRDIPGEAG